MVTLKKYHPYLLLGLLAASTPTYTLYAQGILRRQATTRQRITLPKKNIRPLAQAKKKKLIYLNAGLAATLTAGIAIYLLNPGGVFSAKFKGECNYCKHKGDIKGDASYFEGQLRNAIVHNHFEAKANWVEITTEEKADAQNTSLTKDEYQRLSTAFVKSFIFHWGDEKRIDASLVNKYVGLKVIADPTIREYINAKKRLVSAVQGLIPHVNEAPKEGSDLDIAVRTALQYFGSFEDYSKEEEFSKDQQEAQAKREKELQAILQEMEQMAKEQQNEDTIKKFISKSYKQIVNYLNEVGDKKGSDRVNTLKNELAAVVGQEAKFWQESKKGQITTLLKNTNLLKEGAAGALTLLDLKDYINKLKADTNTFIDNYNNAYTKASSLKKQYTEYSQLNNKLTDMDINALQMLQKQFKEAIQAIIPVRNFSKQLISLTKRRKDDENIIETINWLHRLQIKKSKN